MKHKVHDWDIIGYLIKPNVHIKYHNNIILGCTGCDSLVLTVNNRSIPYMPFDSLEELVDFCVKNRYIGVLYDV